MATISEGQLIRGAADDGGRDRVENVPGSKAKGTIVVYDENNDAVELAAGTNGQVLKADDTESKGLKWGADSSAVSSVFTRTGDVTAAASDYDASQVDNDSGVSGTYVSDALDTLAAAAPNTHAASHTDGTDDIQNATDSQKGLATAAQITKLDGIEAGAEVNPDAAEVKTLYESNADTNAFTDAEKSNLGNQSGTNTGDMSDSDVKTAYENNADTNAFTDAEQTKLSGIEASADVTDATNVAAAGAIMDSDISESEGFMRKTGAGAYQAIKSNLNASVAPTVNDDSGSGYAVGSRWIDTTADKEYVCVDATLTAAVWFETTSQDTSLVDSVFGRTGDVTAAASDYDASQVDNDSTVSGTYVSNALDTLKNAAPNTHASSHENGGGDEISVAGLSGALADPQTPSSHASSHQNGGADEISVAGLSGVLADEQNPVAHATEHTDGTDDIQDATSGQKGLATSTQITKLDGIEDGADVTDSTNVASAGAVMDSDFSAAEGFMRKTGAGAYEAIKSNLNASVAPTVNDDSGSGYAVGSRWIDTTADKEYVCLDATSTAAVWKDTTQQDTSPVDSVFGRTGDVTAAASDYDASQVDNDSTVTGTYVSDALNTLKNAAPNTHAASHTDGSDDIQDATSGQKGLATATQITKLDGIEASADVTDATNVAAAGAIMDSDISQAEGFMRKTGSGTYEAIKSNLNASVAPTANEDSGDGYAVGSLWLDTTADKAYICLDATVSAAVWRDISTLALSDLTGTLAIAAGGTGQTSKTAAFDALSPVTTKGDLIVRDSSNNVRQAVGTNGQVLEADSAQTNGLKWATPREERVDTMTISASAVTPDAASAKTHYVNITENITVNAPSNPVNGREIILKLKQDATGSRTVTLNSIFAFGADLTSFTASTTGNKIDYLGAKYCSVTSKWHVVAVQKGFN